MKNTQDVRLLLEEMEAISDIEEVIYAGMAKNLSEPGDKFNYLMKTFIHWPDDLRRKINASMNREIEHWIDNRKKELREEGFEIE